MEKIVVNTDKKNIEVLLYVNKVLDEVKANAENGIATTEFCVPKDIAQEIRNRIEKELLDSKTKYNFVNLDRRPNEYTGQMQYFTSRTIGNERFFKIRIL